MRKDIVQALFSPSFLDNMTLSERIQQSKLVNLLIEMKNGEYLYHPEVLLGSTSSFVTAVLNARSTLDSMDSRQIHAVIPTDDANSNTCECFLTFGAEV